MKQKHYWLAFAALGALTLVSLILSVCIGSVNIPLGDCVRILLGQDPGLSLIHISKIDVFFADVFCPGRQHSYATDPNPSV